MGLLRGLVAARSVVSGCLAFALCSGAAASVRAEELVLVAGGDVAEPFGWAGTDGLGGLDRFAEVRPLFAGADLVFANLECPLTRAPIATGPGWVLRCQPEFVERVAEAGINLVSLANNHALDASGRGLTDTLAAVAGVATRRPLWWAGAGTDPAAALGPSRFERAGQRVAVFAVAETPVGGPVASIRDKRLGPAIAEAARTADVVIVSAHSGDEYRDAPSAQQIARYRAFIDAGADLVLGHHAHVAQPVERYHGGVVCYGLGNLSFASKSSRHRDAGVNAVSLVVRVAFDAGRAREVGLAPIYTDNLYGWAVGGSELRPRFATPQPLAGPHLALAADLLAAEAARLPAVEPATLVPDGAWLRLEAVPPEAQPHARLRQ